MFLKLHNSQAQTFFLNLMKFSSTVKAHTPICIIGGGSATLNFVGQFLLLNHTKPSQIRIFDDAKYKVFEPVLTQIGSGIRKDKPPMKELAPLYNQKIPFVNSKIKQVIPEKNQIVTESDEIYTYDQLLIHTGQQPNYDSVKGAKEVLDDPNYPAGSIYEYKYTGKLFKMAQKFKGGNALFTEPVPPIKCRGSSGKILFLLEEYWRKQNIKDKTKLFYYAYSNTFFDVKEYNDVLAKKHKDIGSNSFIRHILKEIKKDEKIAIFENALTHEKVEQKFDFIHIIPQHVPQPFIKECNLANEKGYVDVDKETLQHKTYKNIWSSGDAAGLPTSKTFAAICGQTPVLIKNLSLYMKNQNTENFAKYDGHSICPVLIGDKKILLAEQIYGGKFANSIFKNQVTPSRLAYYTKRYIFDFIHWQLIPRGLWHGKKGIKMTKKIF